MADDTQDADLQSRYESYLKDGTLATNPQKRQMAQDMIQNGLVRVPAWAQGDPMGTQAHRARVGQTPIQGIGTPPPASPPTPSSAPALSAPPVTQPAPSAPSSGLTDGQREARRILGTGATPQALASARNMTPAQVRQRLANGAATPNRSGTGTLRQGQDPSFASKFGNGLVSSAVGGVTGLANIAAAPIAGVVAKKAAALAPDIYRAGMDRDASGLLTAPLQAGQAVKNQVETGILGKYVQSLAEDKNAADPTLHPEVRAQSARRAAQLRAEIPAGIKARWDKDPAGVTLDAGLAVLGPLGMTGKAIKALGTAGEAAAAARGLTTAAKIGAGTARTGAFITDAAETAATLGGNKVVGAVAKSQVAKAAEAAAADAAARQAAAGMFLRGDRANPAAYGAPPAMQTGRDFNLVGRPGIQSAGRPGPPAPMALPSPVEPTYPALPAPGANIPQGSLIPALMGDERFGALPVSQQDRLRALLDAYADVVKAAGDPHQIGMFGGAAPTMDSALAAAKEIVERKYGNAESTGAAATSGKGAPALDLETAPELPARPASGGSGGEGAGVGVNPDASGSGSAKPKLADALDAAEQAARDRITARNEAKKGSTTLGAGLGGANDFIEHLPDYAMIGAVKLARAGLDSAEWAKQMVAEFGEAIRPHLATIERQARAIYADKFAGGDHAGLGEARAYVAQRSIERRTAMRGGIGPGIEGAATEAADTVAGRGAASTAAEPPKLPSSPPTVPNSPSSNAASTAQKDRRDNRQAQSEGQASIGAGMTMSDIEQAARSVGAAVPDRTQFRSSFDAIKERANANHNDIARSLETADPKKAGALSPEEYFVGNTVLRNLTESEIPALLKKIQTAEGAGDSANVAKLQAQMTVALSRADHYAGLLYKAGSDAGRRLAFQRAVTSGPFDAASILSRAKAAAGGDLSEAAQRTILDLSNKGRAAEKTISQRINARAEMALQRLERLGGIDGVSVEDIIGCK